jgi:hypothetical protein
MFALRGIAVSLTFFVVLYCLLSLLVAVAWRSLKLLHTKSERSLANLLFGLRILPVAASTLITLGLVVPSFQLREPRSIEEDMGLMPLVLGLCALLLIACGVFRVVTAQTRTSRVVAHWMDSANRLSVETEVVTFCSRRDVPPLTLVGVCKPRVLVSESTVSLLSREELRISLKHEIAHVRSRDNLKKLRFRGWPSWKAPGHSRRNWQPMMRRSRIRAMRLTWRQLWSSFRAWYRWKPVPPVRLAL